MQHLLVTNNDLIIHYNIMLLNILRDWWESLQH